MPVLLSLIPSLGTLTLLGDTAVPCPLQTEIYRFHCTLGAQQGGAGGGAASAAAWEGCKPELRSRGQAPEQLFF